jgi:hypothetical protein
MKNKVVVGLTTGALALLGAVTFTPTASAHDTSYTLYGCGSDSSKSCGYGGVTNSHQRVYACDTYGDNVGIRTYYWLRNGDTGYIDDANGSSSGCSAEFRGSATNTITYFRVCKKLSPLWCGPKTAA